MTVESYIREYPNIVPKSLCRLAIKAFEKDTSHQLTATVVAGERVDIRNSIYLDVSSNAFNSTVWKDIDERLFKCVSKVWKKYSKAIPSLRHLNASIEDSGYELHRYTANKGSYISHIDCGSKVLIGRIASIILYLNDVPKGGETVFDNWGVSVTPKEGHAVIFPSGFTHAHQGKKPLNQDKYIIPTWMQYQ